MTSFTKTSRRNFLKVAATAGPPGARRRARPRARRRSERRAADGPRRVGRRAGLRARRVLHRGRGWGEGLTRLE